MIDLRSDTVTLPTKEMREAMAMAAVGDDVYGEDPTVNALQEKAAAMLGKEAALFVSSGTMGNQLAVLSQTSPGDEIICETSAHIFENEAGALARIAGVQAATIDGARGQLPVECVARKIRYVDIHCPRTALICIENTHNAHGGAVLPLEYLRDLRGLADEKRLPIHMDGARFFNACAALNVDAAQIAAYADTVTFCLSKGLCAPVGSVLCGPKDVIERARKYRKMLGGGTRQAGILAAAGIIALEHMTSRLCEDHENAKAFAECIRAIPGVEVGEIETNIVYFSLPVGVAVENVSRALAARGVRVGATGEREMRAVTHYGISGDEVRTAAEELRAVLVSM